MGRCIHSGAVYKRVIAERPSVLERSEEPQEWKSDYFSLPPLSHSQEGLQLELHSDPEHLYFFVPDEWIDEQTDLRDAYRGGPGPYYDPDAGNYDPERYWTELGQRWLRENADVTPLPDYIGTNFPTGRSG